jgi:hypothetical protein
MEGQKPRKSRGFCFSGCGGRWVPRDVRASMGDSRKPRKMRVSRAPGSEPGGRGFKLAAVSSERAANERFPRYSRGWEQAVINGESGSIPWRGALGGANGVHRESQPRARRSRWLGAREGRCSCPAIRAKQGRWSRGRDACATTKAGLRRPSQAGPSSLLHAFTGLADATLMRVWRAALPCRQGIPRCFARGRPRPRGIPRPAA